MKYYRILPTSQNGPKKRLKSITNGQSHSLLLKTLVDEQDRFLAFVQEGIDQADRGEFIEQEELDARVERMLQR